jgi:uncharacterized protein (TIGR02646 family)
MGSFCSYCERFVNKHDLHVEHIYPQKPHPERSRKWRNFLLACSTCNTYKDKHLGHTKQARLLKRYAWPHLDNTFLAYIYEASGSVHVSATISADAQTLSQATLDMVGLMKTPDAAAAYEILGIAYDGKTTREELWGTAETARMAYQENPSQIQLAATVNLAKSTGHFSIWMEVFKNHMVVRQRLITEMAADPTCFDPVTTAPLTKGRI